MLAIFFATVGSAFAQIFENNFNAFAYDATRLPVEKATIYDPAQTDWQFTHHPSIAFFKGKFYVVFSNGKIGEDEGEQRIQISESSNFNSWTVPVPLASTTTDFVLTPGGIFVANENLMVVYYTRNDNAEDLSRPNPNLYAKYTSDGTNWSAEINLGIPIFPSHRPSLLSSGKLILTGNRDFYYTTDLTGLSGWTKSGKSNFNSGESANLVEGAIIENGDSIYTIFRDVAKQKYLWQESSKDGVNWGTPRVTNFTDNNSKSHLGKLPNGKFYYIGTPDTTSMGSRTPLVLAVSDDGFNYNKTYILAADYYTRKYAGRYKTGQFGYPYSMVHDGCLYIVASRMKEKLEVIKVSLSSLDDIDPMPQKDLSVLAQLDGTKLPLNNGWAAGTITNSNSGTLTGNGEIRINCASNQSYSFQVDPTTTTSFNPTGDFTVEFRLKVVSNNGRGIDIYLRDGITAASLICVTTDKVFLNQTPSKTLYELDGTQFHTYRLVIKRDENVMYLFIDGEYVTSLIRSPNSSSPQLLFGKSNAAAVTEAYLDYLAYDLTGAFKPVITTVSLDLKNFQIKSTSIGARIEWESSAEDINSKYILERSFNGIDFKILGEINSRGNNHYYWIDEDPFIGANYYRISNKDLDGKVNVLAIKSILIESLIKEEINFSPNPVISGETIKIANLKGEVNLEVYNTSGQLISKQQSSGLLVAPNLPGIYIVNFKQGKNIKSRKIIVQ